jgi:hypothetical protein
VSETDAYTAGLFDGEGSIKLCKRQRSKFRRIGVSLPNTCYHLLEFLKSNYGGTIHQEKKTQKKKQTWTWQLGYDKAIDFIKRIRPYLKETEKVRKADLILDKFKLAQQDSLVRFEFEKEFFKNSRHVSLIEER